MFMKAEDVVQSSVRIDQIKNSSKRSDDHILEGHEIQGILCSKSTAGVYKRVSQIKH